MTPLQEAGFLCPKLRLPLRNPLKIAEFAHEVIQDGAKNLLDYGVLRSPIEISDLNIVNGQLTDIRKSNLSFEEAFKASIDEIPHGRYALIFVDDREMNENVTEAIKEIHHSRKMPHVLSGNEITSNVKKWLCEPQSRENDMCIIGTDHQCNGIETEIVVHIYPKDCPWCGISNADPVIISRAKALLIVSTYQRLQCSCGWTLCEENLDGWITPDNCSNAEELIIEAVNISLEVNITDINDVQEQPQAQEIISSDAVSRY